MNALAASPRAQDRCATGIPVLGELPWGSHFCHFYESPRDYLAALVPYFREGILRGEDATWITCAPVRADDARAALRAAVPDLGAHEAAGRIEILDERDWYRRTGAFDAAGTLAAWRARADRAEARGRALRASGNVGWLERGTFPAFLEYEEEVTRAFEGRRAAVLCSYLLDGCHAGAVLDATRLHEFALARRGEEWERVEAATLAETKRGLARRAAELEGRVRERTGELEAALRAHRDFLSVASHELRTPVTALLLHVEAITRGRGPAEVPAALRARLDRVRAQSWRVGALIDRILDVSRIAAHGLEPVREVVDLCDVVRDAAARMTEPLRISGNELRLDLAGPVVGAWDRTRLEQVVHDLLTNAARHAPGSRVVAGVRQRAGLAELWVEDDGPGIAPDRRGRLFERLSPDAGHPDQGLGIGLWLARMVARAHGGDATARDVPGGGARFELSLPRGAAGVHAAAH